MKLGLAVVPLAACLAVAPAQSKKVAATDREKTDAKTYMIDKSYTTLSFTATKWMVFHEEGLFQDFAGTLTYNAVDASKCKIDVTVKAVSLDTRNDTRDKVLRSDDFFDVEKHPTLNFHSAKVVAKVVATVVRGDRRSHDSRRDQTNQDCGADDWRPGNARDR